MVTIPFVGFSLWRIACFSEDAFKEHRPKLKLNKWVYRKVRSRMKKEEMEWFCFIAVFLNMIEPIAIDSVEGSYYNAICGLILALTIPVPSSLHEEAPGYQVLGRTSTDLVSTDFHWVWVSLYTSWEFLWSLMYTMDIAVTTMHLFPCFLYCFVTRRWDLYLMVRTVNIYVVAQVASPWTWDEYVIGQPVIVEDLSVPSIVGGIHLVLALCWLVYYVGFLWRKRLGIWTPKSKHVVAWSRELQFSSSFKGTARDQEASGTMTTTTTTNGMTSEEAEAGDGDEEAPEDEAAKVEKDEAEDDGVDDGVDDEAADRKMLVVKEAKHHVVPSGSVVIHEDTNGVHDVMNGDHDTELTESRESNNDEHEQLV